MEDVYGISTGLDNVAIGPNALYWILFIGVAILSYIVQALLQARFKKASRIGLRSGMTGAEVAMKMLSDLNSPADGILRKVLVKDGDMVEFDAELFMIEEQ